MRRFACPGTLALVLIALLFVPLPAFAQAPKVVTESYHVPTRDPGMELYVRNKRPEGVSRFGAERILLFVHGATYPAESSFDLALGGLSWMDYIAQRGLLAGSRILNDQEVVIVPRRRDELPSRRAGDVGAEGRGLYGLGEDPFGAESPSVGRRSHQHAVAHRCRLLPDHDRPTIARVE